jgi:hypothetical protein
MTISHVAHYEDHNSGGGLNSQTIAVTNGAVGNILVWTHVATAGSAPGTAAVLSGGGVTTWNQGAASVASEDVEVFWGVITARPERRPSA